MRFGRTIVIGTALAVSLSASYAQTRIFNTDQRAFIGPENRSVTVTGWAHGFVGGNSAAWGYREAGVFRLNAPVFARRVNSYSRSVRQFSTTCGAAKDG
jgi:hypothetical protein